MPTTSWDQLAATLGKWLDIGSIYTIFPNLAFFSPHDPGFFDS
ncbi:hypothetical protein [Pseudolysobacter antarcticus]|nr:hypothetical protein [Pseudolysobacter antarcticus]